MTEAALDGSLKAMYIMGENPVLSDPDMNHTIKAFRNLDFLVVQDIFLTETAAACRCCFARRLFCREGRDIHEYRADGSASEKGCGTPGRGKG